MPDSVNSIPLIFFILFILSLLIQLGYYLVVFSRLAFYKPKPGGGDLQPVSVIICARNESENLRKNLTGVLEQDYPDFQVIVVNDCSFDDSGEYLKETAEKYRHLKIVTIEEQEKYQHGKKFALTLGIKAAKHDLLLLTDADCVPNSRNWVRNMQNHFVPGTDIVLGYGAYRKKNTMLNKLIRFDTFYTALQYLSFSLMNITYMGVGRNLAYRKDLFFRNKGFANHYHLLSGDDDLLINETATSNNTRIEINPDSFTKSEPKTTFASWFNQKRRHLTSSRLYKAKHKRMLGILALSHFIFYVSFVTLLILQHNWQIVLALYLLRFLFQMIIFGKAMQVLREIDLLPYMLLLDVFSVVFYPIIAISSLFYKKVKWK
jgi:poly-beta-1,6-N-acetyl-D-glucosamine synthase